MTDWDAVVRQNVAIVPARRGSIASSATMPNVWDCIQETFLEAVRVNRREPVRNWPALLRHLATARALDLLWTVPGLIRARTRASPRRSAGSRVRHVGPRPVSLPTACGWR